MTRHRAVLALAVMLVSYGLACGADLGYHLGLGSGAFARSPNGEFLAYVENHVSIDPPNQSLRLVSTERSIERLWSREKLRQLGEDAEWCDVIVWSSDSSLVAFLINDARVFVYEAGTATLIGELDLVERDGYPTTRMVTGLRFEEAGSRLSYLDCRRRSGTDCQTRVVELGTRVLGV